MNSNTPDTPKSLIHRALTGDEDAWTHLVAVYDAMVYGQCVNHNLQPVDAAAVTNEVFIDVFRILGRFKRNGKELRFHRFLRRITTFKIMDHFRRNGRLLAVPQGGEEQAVDFVGISDESELSDDQVELFWNEHDFDETLRKLHLVEAAEIFGPELLSVYQLVEYEGRSVESVAKELGLLPPEVDAKVSLVAEWLLKKMSELPEGSAQEFKIEILANEKPILELLGGRFRVRSIEVYLLKEIRGMPIPDVACELEMSKGAVRTAAHRVKQWIAKNASQPLLDAGPKQLESSSS